jgi:hypothetical protein
MSELNRSATLRTWTTMRRMQTIVVVLVLAVFAGVGCGWQAYESRMAASAEYFDYLGQAQAVLVDADQPDVSSFGVKIRVPLRFRWIAPKMQDDDDGNNVPVPAREDKKRQPRFAQQTGLPGLLGSWYSVVSDDSGKTRTGSSWMFLFGNYQRYKDRAAGINVEPSTFYDDLVNELAGAIGAPAPQGGEWQYEKVNKLGGYYIASGGSSASPENHYTLIKLESRGTEYRLYLHPGPRAASSDDGGGDAPGPGEELQFALLFVVPRNATQPARLESGIKYCLEWFEADTTVPSFNADGDGGGPAAGF